MTPFVKVRGQVDQVIVDGQYLYLGETREVRQDQARKAIESNPDALVIIEGELEPLEIEEDGEGEGDGGDGDAEGEGDGKPAATGATGAKPKGSRKGAKATAEVIDESKPTGGESGTQTN